MSEIRQAVGRSRSWVLSIAAWIAFALAASAMVHWYVRPEPFAPRVNVRWSPEVDDRQRATLEAQFHLTRGEFREGRTWSYRIADTTSTNLETLVTHPSVEDTYGIDRNSHTVEGAPGRFDGLGFAMLFGFGTSILACIGITAVRRLFPGHRLAERSAMGGLARPTRLVGLVLGIAAVVLLADRYYWAQISQWREDQATNIWLGYTEGFRGVPVGLMSSTGIVNPNGMILVGFVVSALPDLVTVGFTLSVVQVLWVVLLGRQAFGTQWHVLLFATVPSLSSVILRSTSVELWNQYLFASINSAYLFWVIRYLQHRSAWSLPPVVGLVFLAPSLYLAGLVNAVVMTLVTIGVLVYVPPRTRGLRPVVVAVACIALLSVSLTWWPYFRSMNAEQLTSYGTTRVTLPFIIETAWHAIVKWPRYGVTHWADASFVESAIKHADQRILSPSTQRLLWLAGGLYLIQAVFAAVVLGYVLCLAFLNRGGRVLVMLRVNRPVVRVTALAAVFVLASYACGAYLNGPAWMDGERPDQTVQFLPACLLIVFLSPFTVSIEGSAQRLIAGIAYGVLVAFATASLACGFLTIRDHLSYRGPALTEADVPLTDKEQVVDLIAASWKIRSASRNVPADYHLGGGVWDWVPEFGRGLQRWYRAPMTEGRAFDYELLRRHGLTNQQEGIQLRTFGTGRYLVTYAFEEPPTVEGADVVHHVRGRLRVTVVDK